MLESIYIGMTGLSGYSKGLRVIANNTANMNTPGFKSSTMQFSNLFYSQGGQTNGFSYGNNQFGFGLNANGASLNFKAGELRQTGNDLDLAPEWPRHVCTERCCGSASFYACWPISV
jgi:flagellar hook protein FlgE